MHLLWFDNFPRLRLHHVISHHSDTELFPPYQPTLASNFQFHSENKRDNNHSLFKMDKLLFPFYSNGYLWIKHIFTWWSSVKSFTCSSSRSARYRSLSRSRETSWHSFWTFCADQKETFFFFFFFKSKVDFLFSQ